MGGLLVAALFGGALLIFFLDDIVASFRPRYTVVAIVQDAPDLTVGSPVWIAGRHVGGVLSVGLMAHGSDTLSRIAITLELPRDAQGQVRADSRVRLTSIGPISERVVDIVPGTAAAPVLGDGDTLRQDLRPTAAQLAARASRVKAGLDTAIAGLNGFTPEVRTRLEQTRLAMRSLELAMREARALQQDLDANPGIALLDDPEFGAALQRARTTVATLPTLFDGMRAQEGGAAEVAAAVARLRSRADSLSAQLAAASAAMHPNGTLSRLQRDTALQRAIGAARAELDSLIAEARRNPLRFVY